VTGGWAGEEERLRRLGYNGWYNGREVNKFGEVEDTLGASCNKEMTRKKSVRKEAREREIYLTSAAAAKAIGPCLPSGAQRPWPRPRHDGIHLSRLALG